MIPKKAKTIKRPTRKKPTSKTDQWDTFCLEYVKDFDRVRAYKAAGYKGKNYNSCSRTALRLLSINVYVQEKIQELLKGQEKRSVKNADDVVSELIMIGFSNIADYINIDDDGEMKLKGFSDIDRDKLAVVESVKVNLTKNKDGDREYTTTQFKLYDKRAALVDLGKHFGIFERDNRQQNIDWEKIARLMEKQKAND